MADNIFEAVSLLTQPPSQNDAVDPTNFQMDVDLAIVIVEDYLAEASAEHEEAQYVKLLEAILREDLVPLQGKAFVAGMILDIEPDTVTENEKLEYIGRFLKVSVFAPCEFGVCF